jgi:hypothetical protein
MAHALESLSSGPFVNSALFSSSASSQIYPRSYIKHIKSKANIMFATTPLRQRNATSSSSSADLLDLELAMSKPVASTVQPRWQRKLSEQQQAKDSIYRTPSKVPGLFAASKTPKSGARSASSQQQQVSQAAVTESNGTDSVTAANQTNTTSNLNNMCDRFIPSRSNVNTSISMHSVSQNTENVAPDTTTQAQQQQDFKQKLAESLFDGSDLDSKILAFKCKAPRPTETYQNNLRVLYTQNKISTQVDKKKNRHINTAPERILVSSFKRCDCSVALFNLFKLLFKLFFHFFCFFNHL